MTLNILFRAVPLPARRSRPFRSTCALILTAHLCSSAAAMDANDEKSIRLWNYASIDLEGPNATSVASYVASVVTYCSKLTGHDNGAGAEMRRLAEPLEDPQPTVTAQLVRIGAEGRLGDSLGAVPLAPIADVARVKGFTVAEVCAKYSALMKREADRYLRTCRLSDDKQHYVCPHETFTPDGGR